jgi:hypothetical protein
MFKILCVVIGLFFYGGTIKSMDTCNDARLVSIISHEQYGPMGNYCARRSLDKEKTKKYMAHGVDTIVIDSGEWGKNDVIKSGRVKLKIAQLTDDNASGEVITIQAEKNILPYIAVNHQGAHFEIGLRRMDQMVHFSKDIIILVALNNYKKIKTDNAVDTTFLSPIKSEKLHLSVTSGATMQAPSLYAKTVELFVEGDNSLLKADNDTCFKVDDLLFMYCTGSSAIDLTVETKLLQAHSNGKGNISLKGIATEQELFLHEGSLCALELASKKIRMAQGAGTGKLEVCAQESIRGFVSKKSAYDTTYRIPDKNSILLSLLEDAQWKARFIQ